MQPKKKKQVREFPDLFFCALRIFLSALSVSKKMIGDFR